MLGECFRYLQRVLKVIFDASEALWSENLGKNDEKSEISKCSKINFGDFFKRQFYVSFKAPQMRQKSLSTHVEGI